MIPTARSGLVTPSRNTWALAVATVIVILVFLRLLANDLVWDDLYFALGRPTDSSGQGLWQALSRPYWATSSDLDQHGNQYWRPLASALFWIAGVAFGNAAVVYHALSLVAWGAAALSLRGFLRRVAPTAPAALSSWLALLFAAHPLAVEVAAFVTSIGDHVVLACLLTAMGLMLSSAPGKESGARLIRVSLLIALALGFKELGIVAVALPALVYCLQRAQRPVSWRELGRPAPWIACLLPVALYLLLRSWVLAPVEGSITPTFQLPHLGQLLAGIGLALRCIIVPTPAGSAWYSFGDDPLGLVGLALALGATGYFAARAAQGQKRAWHALAGWSLLLLLVLPSTLAVDTMTNGIRYPTRYFHTPLAAVILLSLPGLAARFTVGLSKVLPAVVLLLALLSFARIGEWRTNLTFWMAEYNHHPGSVTETINAIISLREAGRFDEARHLLVRHERDLLVNRPHAAAHALSLRALLAVEVDRNIDAATDDLVSALVFYPPGYNYLLQLAELRQLAGRPDEAARVLARGAAAPWFQEDVKRLFRERLQALGVRREAPAGPDPEGRHPEQP